MRTTLLTSAVALLHFAAGSTAVAVNSPLPEALAALTSTGAVSVSPNKCDDLCISDLATSKSLPGVVFTPNGKAPAGALIYVPANGVDPRSYAVLARDVAAQGFMMVLVALPNNAVSLAASTSSINAIMSSFPSVSSWALGGHFEGAEIAAQYTLANAGVKAVALQEGGLSHEANLASASVRGYFFNAEFRRASETIWYNLGLTRVPKYLGNQYITLEQSTPEYIGYYQLNETAADSVGTLSRADQHKITAAATVHMMRYLDLPQGETAVDYKAYSQASAMSSCVVAQEEIAKLSDSLVYSFDDISSKEELALAEPGWFNNGPDKFPSLFVNEGNSDDLLAPAAPRFQNWCKVLSKSHIESFGAATKNKDQGACADANKQVLSNAKGRVSLGTRLRYDVSWFTKVEFASDVVHKSTEAMVAEGGLDVKFEKRKVTVTSGRHNTADGKYVVCATMTQEQGIQIINRVVYGTKFDTVGNDFTSGSQGTSTGLLAGSVVGAGAVGGLAAVALGRVRHREGPTVNVMSSDGQFSAGEMKVLEL